MAQAKPRIVLYKSDVPGEELATSVVKAAECVDAFSVMQTDFEPVEKTYQVNQDGAFFVANLTDAEAKKFDEQPEVLEIVDDIDVFALGDEPAGPPPAGLPDADDLMDVDEGVLELDPDDTEALETDPYPEWDGEGSLVSPEMLTASMTVEPEGVEDAVRLEMELAGDLADEVEMQLGFPKIPKEKLICLVKCVLKCAFTGSEATEATAPPEISDQQIEAMLRTAGLADGPEARVAADVILWNIRMIYANYAWRYSTGTGVRVAVVDTGIDARHLDLRVSGGVSYVPGVRSWRDDHYHGTHVAGTIAAIDNRRGIIGVAPHARLYAVKVLDRRGSGRLSWILNGLMWCYRARMHVVNLSLGSRALTHNPRIFNTAYEHVGRILRSRGILLVAAAGNSAEPVGNPARCPSYLAVSAVDRRRRRARFSCFGPQVEIAAPGVNIVSTIPGNRYRALSGTSMATPHVAGVAALVKRRRPSWHGDRIRVHLWRTATDLGAAGRDWLYGFGLVNAWNAVR